MSDINCSGCDKVFSKNSLLVRHQRGKANKCLQLIGEKSKFNLSSDKEYVEKLVYDETITKLNDDITYINIKNMGMNLFNKSNVFYFN